MKAIASEVCTSRSRASEALHVVGAHTALLVAEPGQLGERQHMHQEVA